MLDKFPLLSNSADIIISDLSMHYFSESDTRRIIDEIKRVLKPNGILILRVNSINDTFWGAGQGEEIERHFYRDEKGLTKRFFDIDDIHSFFEGWSFIKEPEEKELHRYDTHKEAKDRDSQAKAPGKKTFVCTIQVNK